MENMLHYEIKGPKANINIQGVVLTNCNATMCWRSCSKLTAIAQNILKRRPSILESGSKRPTD